MALTAREIEDRFEEAAITLRRLPNPKGSGPRGYGQSWPDYVQEARHAYGYHEMRIRIVPTAAEIQAGGGERGASSAGHRTRPALDPRRQPRDRETGQRHRGRSGVLLPALLEPRSLLRRPGRPLDPRRSGVLRRLLGDDPRHRRPAARGSLRGLGDRRRARRQRLLRQPARADGRGFRGGGRAVLQRGDPGHGGGLAADPRRASSSPRRRKLGRTHQNVLVFCKGDPQARDRGLRPGRVRRNRSEARATGWTSDV